MLRMLNSKVEIRTAGYSGHPQTLNWREKTTVRTEQGEAKSKTVLSGAKITELESTRLRSIGEKYFLA